MVIDFTDAGTPVADGTALGYQLFLLVLRLLFLVVLQRLCSGNYVSRTGDYNQEPHGINKINDSTGAIHGLDPATTPKWAGYEDTTTTALTELSMIKAMDEIRRAGGKIPTAIFCSLGVRRAYWNLMTSLRRYNEPKSSTGGLTGLSFMYGEKDLPVVADPDCNDKQMHFLHEPEIKMWRDKDWYWEDRAGGVLQWVTDYDAFEGLMKKYWQIGTHQRNAHGKMTNLTES